MSGGINSILIHVVGLSATLPNYIDVADFLGSIGFFYFDSSFHPVPLEQHFIGIRGKPNLPQLRQNLDRITFDKVLELSREGHQVMVFVHARKETVQSAQTLWEMAMMEGALDNFSTQEHLQFIQLGRHRNE
ncbi:hypothetical protein M422DRAFT_272919 [Sphaerobolus stellatus SS14]|uniref:Uncharacterized protein n=1 Tax=Sphaerobolus stellatus (strain SS14) TaxID=990650 RepID=A0A0C9UKR1_SPHS4|nr:hypothetical protein M422DRAFT_272919 [Sphaerobolus stellatus SS14]